MNEETPGGQGPAQEEARPEAKGVEKAPAEPRRPTVAQWSCTTRRLAIANLLVLLAYTFVTGLMWRAMVRSNEQTRELFEATQRPRVGIGNAAGRLAEFRSGDAGTAVVIHFTNAGAAPALRFSVHASSATGSGPHEFEEHYMERYRGERGGVVTRSRGVQRHLPASAADVVYLDEKWLPTATTLGEIYSGKKRFQVLGHFEYCDDFGHYSCDRFALDYKPAPVGDFVSSVTLPCEAGQMTTEQEKQPHAGMKTQPLRRCPQPGEEHALDTGDATEGSRGAQ